MKLKNKITTLALASTLGLAGAANAQSFIGNATPGAGDSGVFAFWNFESIPTDGTAIGSTFYGQAGSTSIDFSGYGGNLGSFGGSTINEQTGFEDAEGDDLALQNGTSGAINGTFLEIAFDMSNLEDLSINYSIRGSGTGVTTAQWSYSTDGVSFSDFGPNVGGADVSLTLASDEFGTISTSGLNEVSSAFLRLSFSGGSLTSSAGNNRIDNLTLSGTAVPEPSSYALLAGLLGLGYVMVRRRQA